jgi:hypothetical protein
MKRAAPGSIGMLLIATPLFADEIISFGVVDGDARELAAYERAVRIGPVDPKTGDQVRIWYVDVLGGRVNGFVVTTKGTRKCALRYDENADGRTIKRGRCGSLQPHRREAARALSMLTEIVKLNGKSVSCPIMDGWRGRVSGAFAGQIFQISIGNNDQCDDADSRLINQLGELIEKSFEPSDPK